MTNEAASFANAHDLLGGGLPEALARDDLANLAVLLRHADDGCFAVAVYNDALAREQVAAALRRLVAPLPVFEWTYSPLDPYPSGYLNRLSEAQRRARAVVFFFGLDQASPDVIKSLDYQRERLSGHPHGLVFWVSPGFVGEMARIAPHFWSQRSGVFDFTIAHPAQPQPDRIEAWRGVSDDAMWNDREERQRALRLYQALLKEYAADPSTPAHTLFDLHIHLAQLLYYDDRLAEAREHALAALALSERLDRPQARADALRLLGDVKVRIDDLAGARADYDAALPIYRAIGARLGEANTLLGFGDERLAAGDPEAALEHYITAQSIYARLDDRYHQILSLIRIGLAEGALGRDADAMAHLASAARLADAIQDHRLRGRALDLLAEVCAARGDRRALDDLLDALIAAHPEDAELRSRRQP